MEPVLIPFIYPNYNYVRVQLVLNLKCPLCFSKISITRQPGIPNSPTDMICWTEESIILWLAGNDLVTDCGTDAQMLRCSGAWMHVSMKIDVFCFCICYYFCICICVYIWFVFIVLCIVCICGTQLLVCSSDQYLASDAPGVATHYWLDRHICVDSDDDEVLVWKLEALAGMILVKLGLSLSQRYLKTWGSTPWSEWAPDIEALPEH